MRSAPNARSVTGVKRNPENSMGLDTGISFRTSGSLGLCCSTVVHEDNTAHVIEKNRSIVCSTRIERAIEEVLHFVPYVIPFSFGPRISFIGRTSLAGTSFCWRTPTQPAPDAKAP